LEGGVETKLVHLSDVPIQKGLPTDLKNPLRPEWFAGRCTAHLTKDAGLTQFGINVVTLEPGARSSLRHWHEEEDEFVYVLSGCVVLIDENGEHEMREGSFAGFPAGAANAHHLLNRADSAAVFMAAGTRKVGKETVHYPDEGMVWTVERDAKGNRL
jgi:uncharacterized cupin superfamily protein